VGLAEVGCQQEVVLGHALGQHALPPGKVHQLDGGVLAQALQRLGCAVGQREYVVRLYIDQTHLFLGRGFGDQLTQGVDLGLDAQDLLGQIRRQAGPAQVCEAGVKQFLCCAQHGLGLVRQHVEVGLTVGLGGAL